MHFQEKKCIRPTFSAEHIFGGVLLAMYSNDFICFYDWAECRLIRRIDVNVKVSRYPAMNVMYILRYSVTLHPGSFFK